MSTDAKIPALGDRVRVSGWPDDPHDGVAGAVVDLGLDPASPTLAVLLLNGELVARPAGRFTTDPLPHDASWNDYLTAHGGPTVSGWWITLHWYTDAPNPRPELVGPYPTHEAAAAAMDDSLLMSAIAEDTTRSESLDEAYVRPEPATIGQTCAEFHRVTLIDPTDPDHFAPPKPPPDAGEISIQAAALRSDARRTPETPASLLSPHRLSATPR